jgi:hypothetical protein
MCVNQAGSPAVFPSFSEQLQRYRPEVLLTCAHDVERSAKPYIDFLGIWTDGNTCPFPFLQQPAGSLHHQIW